MNRKKNEQFTILGYQKLCDTKASSLKHAATDIRYFARSKFFRSYVHKKNFSLI